MNIKLRVYIKNLELREILIRRRLRIRQFAKKIETPENYIHQLLSGERSVGPEVQERILIGLNMDPVEDWDIVFKIEGVGLASQSST